MFTVKYLLADNQVKPPAAKKIKCMLPSDHVSVIMYISLIVFIGANLSKPHINVKFMQLCVCLSVVLSICS